MDSIGLEGSWEIRPEGGVSGVLQRSLDRYETAQLKEKDGSASVRRVVWLFRTLVGMRSLPGRRRWLNLCVA
jgi:hypothetical protein